MNVEEQRKMVKERIDTMVEHRLDALMTLLKNQQDDLLVREDDWAITNYGKAESATELNAPLTADEFAKRMRTSLKKREAAKKLIDGLTKSHLDAVASFLKHSGDGYIVGEEEWAEIDQRAEELESGKVKGVPGDEVYKRLMATLNNYRK